MMTQPFRSLLTLGLALAFFAIAVPASAQSPADAKRTLKAYKLFYKEPGMIEVDPRYMRGTLMLTGFVATEEMSAKAEKLANELKGVKEVRNRTKVRAPDVASAPDDVLQGKIDKKIDDDEDLSKAKAKGALEVKVSSGNAKITGKLGDYTEAGSLINDVRKIPGIQTIDFEDLSY